MFVYSGRIWKLKWKRSWEHVTNYFDFCQADNRIFPYRWLSETPLTTALLRGITLHRSKKQTTEYLWITIQYQRQPI